MDQNEFNDRYNKCMDEGRKLEAQARQQGNTYMECTAEDFKRIMEKDEELGNWYIEWLEEQNRNFKEHQKFVENHPDIPQEYKFVRQTGLPPALSLEESIKRYEEAVKFGKFHNLLWEIKQINLSEQSETQILPPQFLRTTKKDEFAISRLIADPMNHIHKMLEKFTPPQVISDNLYVTQAESENSVGDIIRLEFRFRAPSQEEANKQAQEYIQRLTGRQKKVYEACWALANKKRSRTIHCNLTELMLIAYPDRKNNESFSVNQREQFFQDLYDISQTQFIVTKKKNQSKKNGHIDKFVLPFITILKTSDYNMISDKKSARYPNSLTFSALHNPEYERETLYNVGAAIKHKTLGLRPEDIALAEWIQVRMSQNMNENHIDFKNREDLLKLAGLNGIKHSGMANKKLLDKFSRIKEKGIIVSYPKRVVFPFLVITRYQKAD